MRIIVNYLAEGEITMCGLLDKYETRGIQKEMEKSRGQQIKLIVQAVEV